MIPQNFSAPLDDDSRQCWENGLFIKRGFSRSGKQRYLLANGFCTTGNPTGRVPVGLPCPKCGQASAKRNGKYKKTQRQKYLCNECHYGWVEPQ